MEKKFDYKFNNSLGIIFKTYYGPITIEDIESSWKHAFENDLIPKEKKGFILDYRNANFNFEIEENILIANFYKKHIDIFRNYKIAIITENSKDIVIPILVESLDEGYHSQPFSTLEAAITWILS